MPADWRARFGKTGEELASRALRRRGYAILDTRFRTRAGELDIIARDGATVVFVEVKARSAQGYGTPLEAITARKRRKVCAMAAEYLLRRRLAGAPCRFDVVAVRISNERQPDIEILQNAFCWGE